MRENFVTHFNSGFLLQGISLYLSMQRHLDDFTLWVICLDDLVSKSLRKIELPNIKIIERDVWETEELRTLRDQRSFREYCWTVTPSVPKFVFNIDANVKRVTYVDADLWFRKDPRSIFNEFSDSKKSVLITDHHYAPEFDQSSISGQYCVQFMTFVRDDSEIVRSHWESQCRDWCYAYHDNGKFGDQKYLDAWPSKYEAYVHLLGDKTAILAPWNATRFPYGNSLIWHFHGVSITRQGKKIVVDYGYAPLPDVTIDNIYEPYLGDLRKAAGMLREDVIHHLPQRKSSLLTISKAFSKRIYFRCLRMSCHKVVII
jgi:hypothetical protein